ncbi:MAG: RTX toxin, partial [Paracoccaceae bacterium]
MVKAIDFVVRDSAGGVVRGAVAGGGSNFVQLGAGEEISLNLARQSVVGYAHNGNDLVITLIDGREIVLSGYFNETGEANQLYLSQNGDVAAVELTNAGDGTMFAAYGPTEGWDKFSTIDDLRFGQTDDLALAAGATDEPAGMAGFVPGLIGLGPIGAGLAGVGVVGGLVGSGGG